jgi:hypothetical protein
LKEAAGKLGTFYNLFGSASIVECRPKNPTDQKPPRTNWDTAAIIILEMEGVTIGRNPRVIRGMASIIVTYQMLLKGTSGNQIE